MTATRTKRTTGSSKTEPQPKTSVQESPTNLWANVDLTNTPSRIVPPQNVRRRLRFKMIVYVYSLVTSIVDILLEGVSTHLSPSPRATTADVDETRATRTEFRGRFGSGLHDKKSCFQIAPGRKRSNAFRYVPNKQQHSTGRAVEQSRIPLKPSGTMKRKNKVRNRIEQAMQQAWPQVQESIPELRNRRLRVEHIHQRPDGSASSWYRRRNSRRLLKNGRRTTKAA
jgi:hypothetical protein